MMKMNPMKRGTETDHLLEETIWNMMKMDTASSDAARAHLEENDALKELFVNGHFVHPALRGWRRFSLKMMIVQDYNEQMRLVASATNARKTKPGPLNDPLDCPHPAFARRAGGNRYGEYVHRKACGTRLTFDRAKDVKPKKEEEAPYDPPPRNRATPAPKKKAQEVQTSRAAGTRRTTAASSSSGGAVPTLFSEDIGKSVAESLTPTLHQLTLAIQALTQQQSMTVKALEASQGDL
jgi:hypothetical protein